MSETTSFKFTCYHCKSENHYPALKDEDKKGKTVIIKRCINCAMPNKIVLPEGCTGEQGFIHRGMKE